MSKISAEALSLAGDKYLGRKYSEMDCQRFAENCMADVGLFMDLGGSNSWFREMTWRGTPEECKKIFGSIPKGALLYIREFDGKEPEKYRKDGLGNAKHMGIKTGRTGAEMVYHAKQEGNENAGDYNYGDGGIHSSETREHVCSCKFADETIKNGGWNMVGLYDLFTYGEKVDRILAEISGGGTPEPTPDPDSGGDETGGIDFGIVDPAEGSSVFLRKTPNQKERIWWRIPKGNVIEIDGKTIKNGKTWYHGTAADVEGKFAKGYMMADYVRIEQPPAEDEKEPMDPGDGFPQEETVTISLAAEDATLLLSFLELISSQIIKQIGRG